jgi:hypothetical protein
MRLRLPNEERLSIAALAGVSIAAWWCGATALPASAQQLQRLKYNHPGLVVDLGVGLWGTPLPMDYDEDGDLDLVVACPDKPYNGIYFFENPGGSAKMPVFKAGRRIAKAMQNLQVSYVDGTPRVLCPGEEFVDFRSKGVSKRAKLPVPESSVPTAKRIRANQWRYVDYDGDGVADLVIGVEDWGDYGWDDAYDKSGRWANGPLHGLVYWLRNAGSNERPQYQPPVKVEAAGQPVDTYGMPSPCFADFDGDGDLDLICGEFRDGFTYFRNSGTRKQPRYDLGQPVQCESGEVRMDLCMIVPVVIDWDGDGDVDLIVGQEDGRVAFIENTGKLREGRPLFEQPRFFQQEADEVKFGVLATPVGFDWDGDGDTDLLAGNSAGYIGFIENLGGTPARWAASKCLEADGKVIRILAGANGSIQGPAEAKWGYTTISVADWDHDGLPDIIANSIWGKVIWFRNVGSRTSPRLASAAPIEVAWPADATPRPPWNWWSPSSTELATEWRTTPVVFDLDQDGLNDLVMLDSEGFLAFFRRERSNGKLVLLPGRRAISVEEGTPSAFDGGHKSVTRDVSGKNRNDLAYPDVDGQVYFLRNDDVVARPAQGAAGGTLAEGAKSGPRLRLNAGWAGRSGRRKLCVADVNQDGRPDLLVNGQNANLLLNVTPAGSQGEWVLKDTGSVAETVLAGHDTSPTVIDLDGDGKSDVLIGAEDGFFYHLVGSGATAPAGETAGKPASAVK